MMAQKKNGRQKEGAEQQPGHTCGARRTETAEQASDRLGYLLPP
jgi:hypothetical protein